MNSETLLLRQVNPSWMQEGRITSQIFRPFPKDEGKLSVYDGDMITPQESWNHFVNTMEFKSVGVLAVTVSECNSINLSVESDPEPFPEHAVINFQGCSNSQITKKAKRLKEFAEERDWLYRENPD